MIKCTINNNTLTNYPTTSINTQNAVGEMDAQSKTLLPTRARSSSSLKNKFRAQRAAGAGARQDLSTCRNEHKMTQRKSENE